MLRLLIGNKAYSSWSMRGGLAVRQSRLPFEEIVVPLYDADWGRRRQDEDLAPSAGKVPILWDGDIVVWDSLAIVEYLAERSPAGHFWPDDAVARAMARSMAAEMHAGFAALRREHGMNIRRRYPPRPLSAAVEAELARLFELWAQARARFAGNGDYLFGSFGAVDIMFAPVATRLVTHAIPMPRFAATYLEALFAHRFVQDWIAGAQAEDWVIERFEQPPAARA